MITFPAGTSFHQAFAFIDTNGDAVNLTGASNIRAVFYLQPREGSDSVLTLSVTGGSLTVLSAIGGTLRADIDEDDLDEGEYVYEIRGTLASGDDQELGRGGVLVTESFITEDGA